MFWFWVISYGFLFVFKIVLYISWIYAAKAGVLWWGSLWKFSCSSDEVLVFLICESYRKIVLAWSVKVLYCVREIVLWIEICDFCTFSFGIYYLTIKFLTIPIIYVPFIAHLFNSSKSCLLNYACYVLLVSLFILKKAWLLIIWNWN